MTKTTPTTAAPTPPRSLREYLNGPPRVTQRALALRVGCHQSMVSMLVRGQRLPRALLATKLHRVTGVPLDTLLRPKRSHAKKGAAE